MPRVSITLPSLRPNFLSQCLAAIYESAEYDDYEVLVVSPFEVRADKVRWIEEKQKNGNCRAHALAYEHASGDIIVAMTDYIIPRRKWLKNAVEHVSFYERKIFPYCSGLFWSNSSAIGPTIGTIFGRYYPYYPIATRKSLEAIGGWYSCEFVANYGDADIGLRIWAAGGACQVCWDSVIAASYARSMVPSHQIGLKAQEQISCDQMVFVKKWQKIYGEGWSTERRASFNCDLPLAYLHFDDMGLTPLIVRPNDVAGGNVQILLDELPPERRYDGVEILK
ncbi:hypothetical protein CCP2SC5_60052 [Azospirillaceae bacterium]